MLDYSRYNFKGRKGKLFAFSLQTKIILYGFCCDGCLLGMILLFFSERNNTLVGMDPLHKVVTLLFNSVSFLSAGFVLGTCRDTHDWHYNSYDALRLYWIIPWIYRQWRKNYKFCRLHCCRKSYNVRQYSCPHRRPYNCYGSDNQSIYDHSSKRRLNSYGYIHNVYNRTRLAPLDLFLEVSSAFTNLGVSAGLTEHLSVIGKWLIIASMLVGRIGSLAFILAWVKRSLVKSARTYSYPEERIMLE